MASLVDRTYPKDCGRKTVLLQGGLSRLFVILPVMLRKVDKPRKHRPPRIRFPQQQKAIFTVGNQKFVGIVQRLSWTGGSALFVKGLIPE